jgi:hypothetical protein
VARSPAIAPTSGGGGSTYDVSPPAATTESTAAGVGLAAKTFGAFTGADAASIDGYTARTVNAAGSTSWSGSGLGAYTPSGGADGDAGVLALDATIGGVVVATALHDYTRAAAGAASWSTIHTVDFTSDITDLTLTKGAGDTNLRNAADDATKAVVGYADRTPTTTSTAVITAAAGKFLLTSDSGGASTKSAFTYTELTESGTGVDWSDRSKSYAIDIVVSSLDWGSNGDVIFIGLGTSASGINSGTWFGVRLDRDGGTDFVDAGRRYVGSGENGADQNASASAITDRAIRIIVSGGVIADVYWQAGTTPLEGFPTPSGSVFKSFEGGRAISMEASPETTLGATFYVIAEALSTSGSNVVVGIEQIRVQEFA